MATQRYVLGRDDEAMEWADRAVAYRKPAIIRKARAHSRSAEDPVLHEETRADSTMFVAR